MRGTIAENAIAKLEIDPPRRLAVGRGSAFVIGGYCYHPAAATRALAVQLGEERQSVERFRLPREDVFGQLPEDAAGRPYAFRSGFVAMPTLVPISTAGNVELSLVMALADGEEKSVPLGRIRLDPTLAAPSAATERPFPGSGPQVAICMATYNPPPELLRRQLDSVRAQSHGNWLCLISDDYSSEEGFEGLRAEVAGDERFVVDRNTRRLGFYGNFERALSMAPPSADYVTLCDQDDRWHPEKLERLLERIADGAQLVYSDARVVDPQGNLIHDSYWSQRRNNYTNFASLLLANSVTGAASLFRRELLDDVLPFPPKLDQGAFHDHWLATVALSLGRIDYIEEPLYDYVQHQGAVIGHSTANRIPKPVRQHLIERLRNPGEGSRIAYYYKWYQQRLFAQVLRLRCSERMAPAKRRVLRRLLSADDGVAGIAWLLARRLRRLWGHDETLDRELLYAYALLRRRAVSAWTLGRRRPGRWLSRDASIPPAPTQGGST
ncbi:MAG: glycosyltransferase family 2 protein [Solirubrobacterales bacterium]